jgi:hypothetical protein
MTRALAHMVWWLRWHAGLTKGTSTEEEVL